MAMAYINDPGRQQERRPGADPGERLEAVLRGCWAVLVLFLTAVDELVTALLGIRPLTPLLRKAGHVVADEYRAGQHGWIDAEVIDPDNPDRVER